MNKSYRLLTTILFESTQSQGNIVYLPTFSESNAWDFHLVMTKISGNVPVTSEDFQRISEDFPTNVAEN